MKLPSPNPYNHQGEAELGSCSLGGLAGWGGGWVGWEGTEHLRQPRLLWAYRMDVRGGMAKAWSLVVGMGLGESLARVVH